MHHIQRGSVSFQVSTGGTVAGGATAQLPDQLQRGSHHGESQPDGGKEGGECQRVGGYRDRFVDSSFGCYTLIELFWFPTQDLDCPNSRLNLALAPVEPHVCGTR